MNESFTLSLLSYSYMGYGIATLELLIHIAILPLSALNLHAIISTSALHINLKQLLLCQSTAIHILSASRLVELCIIIASRRLLTIPSVALDLTRTFGVCVNGLVGYVLVVERIYATVRVKDYEQRAGAGFGMGCMAFLVGLG